MSLHEHLIAEFLKKGEFDVETFLFDKQLQFVKDTARFSTAVCSVRAGKTTACAADLISTALAMPRTTGLYITLARSSAERIVWPEIHSIVRTFRIDCDFNETKLSVKFPNGSVIYCNGANTEAEMEKLRGLSNVALVYIDESQAFRSHLKELVEDVLVKRLYDLNGRLRLIGTPGPVPTGYFHEASQSDKWSHHSWTLHNNPWIEKKSGLTVAELIQQDMDRKGVDINDPSIQRECFGRWVLDENALLLEYNAKRNHYDELPLGNYSYILGIDLGYDDSDSLSVLAWSDKSPKTYLVDEVVTPKQLIDPLVDQINLITKKYTISKMIADTGGLGKKIVESIAARWQIPLVAADKQRKMENYALLNNALKRGDFIAKSTSRFAQDCNLLERDRDKSTSEKIIVKGHSDAVDSVLYAFKESPAYYYMPPKITPRIGTPEADAETAETLLNHHIEKLEKERQLRENPGINWTLDQDGQPPWTKWSE